MEGECKENYSGLKEIISPSMKDHLMKISCLLAKVI